MRVNHSSYSEFAFGGKERLLSIYDLNKMKISFKAKNVSIMCCIIIIVIITADR